MSDLVEAVAEYIGRTIPTDAEIREKIDETPNPATARERVDELEALLRQQTNKITIPVRHYFAHGLYAREMTLPADAMAVGKIHKTQHINVLSKGEVTMLTADGPFRVSAPYTWVVEPGKKAAAYAHCETVWTSFCVNPTDERDLVKLEAALISPAYLDLTEDARDYLAVLHELGITEYEAIKITMRESDQMPMPPGDWPMRLASSDRHGIGVHVTCDLPAGSRIGPARCGALRTPIGRFTNHAAHPNCRMVPGLNGDIDLVTLTALVAGDEATVDYRHARSVAHTGGESCPSLP